MNKHYRQLKNLLISFIVVCALGTGPAIAQNSQDVALEDGVIYFPFAASDIAQSPTVSSYLDGIASQMNQDVSKNIKLKGHTDNVGPDAGNQALGQSRADEIQGMLVSRGIDAGRIMTFSGGETQPIADNSTEEGRGMNRRVEFKWGDDSLVLASLAGIADTSETIVEENIEIIDTAPVDEDMATVDNAATDEVVTTGEVFETDLGASDASLIDEASTVAIAGSVGQGSLRSEGSRGWRGLPWWMWWCLLVLLPLLLLGWWLLRRIKYLRTAFLGLKETYRSLRADVLTVDDKTKKHNEQLEQHSSEIKHIPTLNTQLSEFNQDYVSFKSRQSSRLEDTERKLDDQWLKVHGLVQTTNTAWSEKLNEGLERVAGQSLSIDEVKSYFSTFRSDFEKDNVARWNSYASRMDTLENQSVGSTEFKDTLSALKSELDPSSYISPLSAQVTALQNTSFVKEDEFDQKLSSLRDGVASVAALSRIEEENVRLENALQAQTNRSNQRYDDLGEVWTQKWEALGNDMLSIKQKDSVSPSDLDRRIQELEKSLSNADAYTELQNQNSQLRKLVENTQAEAAQKIQKVSEDVEGRWHTLTASLEKIQADMRGAADQDYVQQTVQSLEDEIKALKAWKVDALASYQKLTSDHENLDQRLAKVNQDNLSQDEKIAELTTRPAPISAAPSSPKKKINLEDIKPIVNQLSIKTIVVGAGQKDELQKIKGIGPFIEKKINALGIYTFEQIAHLNTIDVGLITDAIQFFPGRIQRDDWMKQAKELYIPGQQRS